MKLDEKKKIVEVLREKFSRSIITIITDYKGLDVATINELRRKLGEVDVEYRVAKNSLLARAAEGSDVAFIKDNFSKEALLQFMRRGDDFSIIGYTNIDEFQRHLYEFLYK